MAALDPRPTALWINDDCREKLAARDLSLDDALWVLSHDPLWVRQKPQLQRAVHDRLRRRPGRWRLIGRSLTGQVISVVVELPDPEGRSQVVTAYLSPGRDRARYDEYRRRGVAEDSQRAWLETLDPEVRLEAEAEIAFYDNEDLWEWEVVDDDWKPNPELGMGLLVDFTARELLLIFDALGRHTDFAGLMKEMLLERARAGLSKPVPSESVGSQ